MSRSAAMKHLEGLGTKKLVTTDPMAAEIGIAQVHATLAVADEIRNLRDKIGEVSRLIEVKAEAKYPFAYVNRQDTRLRELDHNLTVLAKEVVRLTAGMPPVEPAQPPPPPPWWKWW